MRMRPVLLGIVLLLCVMVFWFMQMKHQHGQDSQIRSTLLPAEDTEKIIIDPSTHHISVTTKEGTKIGFLPSTRPSAVEIRKNGDVVVTAKQMGAEHGVFVGSGFRSGDLLMCGGVDLFYFRKIDLGLFLSDATKNLADIRIGAGVSYTIWHDLRITVGLDHHGQPNLFITERF